MSIMDWVFIGFAGAVVVFVDICAIVFYLLYKDHERARIDWKKKGGKNEKAKC